MDNHEMLQNHHLSMQDTKNTIGVKHQVNNNIINKTHMMLPITAPVVA